jgi:DNA-binding MarR family transcriptional regulator
LLRVRKAHPFTALRDGLGLTDGTLSVHLSKLEEGGLISIEKTFEGKKPLTLVRVTPLGRRLFKQYVAELQDIVPGLGPGQ